MTVLLGLGFGPNNAGDCGREQVQSFNSLGKNTQNPNQKTKRQRWKQARRTQDRDETIWQHGAVMSGLKWREDDCDAEQVSLIWDQPHLLPPPEAEKTKKRRKTEEQQKPGPSQVWGVVSPGLWRSKWFIYDTAALLVPLLSQLSPAYLWRDMWRQRGDMCYVLMLRFR